MVSDINNVPSCVLKVGIMIKILQFIECYNLLISKLNLLATLE